MGGQVFRSRSDPLNVVRLQTELYIKLRDHYQRSPVSHFAFFFDLADFRGSVLLKFYKRVTVPPEAPEKHDHGDIDVLVEGALFNFTSQELSAELDAQRHMKAGNTDSFAIRILEDSDTFFQLDIHQCKEGFFEWETLIYTYGDIWHIIGFVVTRFGLVINDCGLHARIKEIEITNRKDSLLLLTSDPLEMMNFLGLDAARYAKPFTTLDELFEWVITMPLFRKQFFAMETTEKRPMYAKFVTEWLPQKMTLHANASPPEGAKHVGSRAEALISGEFSNSTTAGHLDVEAAEDADTKVSRADERNVVLTRALLRFNKREEYQKMLEEHKQKMLKDAMWKEIASLLPVRGKELSLAMTALKNLLWWNDGQPLLKMGWIRGMEKVPALDGDTVGETLLPWIKEHWGEAVRLYEGHARY